MARPLRLEHPNGLWLVSNRRDERHAIFRDDEDRESFIRTVGRVAIASRWHVLAYGLADRHYVLLIRTPETNLSTGMRQINGIYTQYFNRRYRRKGSLMEGRFRGVIVEQDANFAELLRYAVTMPVTEGAARSAASWKWSSYRATAGQVTPPEWLDVDEALTAFGRSRKKAQESYRQFIAAGKRSDYDPWSQVKGQVFLGSEEFRRKMMKELPRVAGSSETRERRVLKGRPNLSAIFGQTAKEFRMDEKDLRRGRGGTPRTMAAFLARREGSISLGPIARALGIAESAVSRLARLGEEQYEGDADFRRSADRITKRII
ncbi:MAG: addiction module toxin RelE [Thermoanaerobaculia bacterium]